jgi:hypothetical protein
MQENRLLLRMQSQILRFTDFTAQLSSISLVIKRPVLENQSHFMEKFKQIALPLNANAKRLNYSEYAQIYRVMVQKLPTAQNCAKLICIRKIN